MDLIEKSKIMYEFSNKNIDIAYSIEENDWNGQQSLQFVLKDIVYSNE